MNKQFDAPHRFRKGPTPLELRAKLPIAIDPPDDPATVAGYWRERAHSAEAKLRAATERAERAEAELAAERSRTDTLVNTLRYIATWEHRYGHFDAKYALEACVYAQRAAGDGHEA